MRSAITREERCPQTSMQFMNAVVDAVPNLSVIVKNEWLTFDAPPEYAPFLLDFVKSSHLFELSSGVVEITIAVRKKYKLKVPDAIIAATALAHDFILITHNTSDFTKYQRAEINRSAYALDSGNRDD